MKPVSLFALFSSVIWALTFSTSTLAAKQTRQPDIDLPFGERSIMSEQHIRERTAPTGKLCLEGGECGNTLIIAETASSGGTAKSGEEVYQTYCMACHANGVGGAPKPHDSAAWEGRANLASVINGLGIMPARGGCMDCSDDELQSAIDFMSN